MNSDEPTQQHEPISDATRVDLDPVQASVNATIRGAAAAAEGRLPNPASLIEHHADGSESLDMMEGERYYQQKFAAEHRSPEQVAADGYYRPGRRALRTYDEDGQPYAQHIEASAAAMARPDGEPLENAPGPDYSDVEAGVLRSIETAQMLAELRVSGEQIDPAATEATVERIRALRYALGGVGQVGQHFNAVGTPVGEQVAVILTGHEVEALIMRLTGKVRLETI